MKEKRMQRRILLAVLAVVVIVVCLSICPFSQNRSKAACAHTHLTEIPGSYVAATCTTGAYSQIHCNDCGATLKKEYGKALGHDWNRAIATCTENKTCKRCGTIGQKAYGHSPRYPSATCTEDNTCTSCGVVLEKAGGHNWNRSSASCTEPKKCTKCGRIDQNALGHNWYPATCTSDEKCTRCGATGSHKAFGHTPRYPSATCTEDNTCTSCGVVLEKAGGHKWNRSSASCTEAKKCTKCGKVAEKALGHNWNRAIPTCTEDKACTRCGAVDQKAYGHTPRYPSATCTEDNTCTSCGIVLEKAGGHKWNRDAATCTDDKKCQKCGKIAEKALGHNWYPATCTEDQKCTRCGEIGTQKAFGHHAKYPSATCTEDNVCTSCGIVLEKAGGHKWNRTAASCTEDKKCTKCGKIAEKALGHDWNRAIATCTEDQSCKRCGVVGQKAYGHTPRYPSATCTEDNTCTSCGIVLEKAGGHKWNHESATCSEDKKCQKCGKIAEKALGHNWYPATCTEDQKCTRCGEIGTQKAFGHHAKYPSATCTEDNICTSCGIVLEKAGGHKWNHESATCTEDKKCQKCGKIAEKALGHNWYPATCTEDQKCTRCGEIGTQKAFGHHAKYPSATCTEDNTCTSCGIVLEKAGGHKWNRESASCTEDKKCLKCGRIEEKAGHKWNHAIATCTEDKKCTVCGTVDQKAYGHHAKYPSATCTEDNTCTSCGEVLEKATGHRWDIPKATCTQAQKCTKCGAKGEKATGHHFEEVKSLYVEPTCGKGGSKTFKCTDCGLTAGENIEPTNSHKWEEIERHLPTVTANGYVLYHCPGCDLEDKRTLRSLGELKVDQTELYFSEVADSRVIKLLSLYKDSTIEVVTDEASSSWLSVEQSSGTDTYTVKAANNDAEIDRSAQITFRDTLYNREARVNVKQSTQPGCRIIFVTGESGDNANITRTVARGSSLEGIFPADPKSPDYFRFDGWYSMIPGTSMKATQYTSNSVAPNVAELKLYATWIEKKYYIVYDGNGQTSGAMARTKATCLKNVTLAENQFKKNGYVLDSWNTKKDGSGTRYAENAVVTNLVKGNAADGAEVRLYAQWVKEKRVKVTFNVNGGSDPKKKVDALGITVVYKEPYGDLPKLPAGVNPPENKVFAGWEDSNHNLITAESDVTNDKDHVLYARWKANTYTIKFSGNGAYGGTMNSITAKYGEKVKIPECAFDGGVGFECWNTQRDGYGEHFKGGKTYNALITDTSVDSITLYAIWTEYRFTVKYVDPFYSSNVIETVPASKVGHVYRLREAWEINGLKFLGWSRDFGGIIKSSHDRSKIIGAGEPVFFETGFWDSNIRTFYPVYESQDKNKIALIYHTNGGSTPSKVEYLEKKKDTYWLPDLNDYDKNTKPKKSGYEFCGWSKNSYGSPRTYFVETTADTEYISLYAIWSPKTWVKLTLDYGYDNKTGEVTPTGFGEYILPGAERDDYLFEGWLAEDGTLYKKGYELRDLETDTTLKAQWTRRTYNVEFYDRGTEKLLYSKTYRSDQKLDFTPDTDIVGKNFDGWEYKSKHYDSNAKVSEFVNMKTPIAINLVDLEKPYKLYAHYDGVRKDGYITVYYHMNGEQVTGGPTGPTFTPKTTGYIGIKTSPDAPSRPGLEFLGWSAYPGGSYCKAGETLTYPIYQDANSQLTEITLYARWGSKYKIILDSNGYKDAKKDTIKIEALPGSEVELKKYKKSFGDPKGYTLIGWGVTQNEVALSVDGVFTVPENDVTLYAIWNADTYTVRFRNAYGKEIARADIQYGKPFRICDLNIPRTELGIDGYSLSGWKYCDNTSGYYKNVSETDEITITRETWFVATYSELPGVDGKVIIDYLPGGGVGGPGTVEYEPGECDIDMTAPRRDGYRFAGWAYFQSTNIGVNLDSVTPIVNFAAGRNHTLTGRSGQRIRLIAVWVRKDSVSFNTIQDELDYEYGPGAFGEERLLRNYVSPDWEKLNDTTYYVIRTWRGSSVEDFESTVMVMQYDNGGWNLKAYGTLEGIWTNIRLNILTSQKNTSAKILDHTFEVVNTAAELGISFYCAPAGMIISGVHYLAKAHEIAIQNAAYHDLYNAVCEAADDEVKDKLNEKIESAIFGLALENLLKSKNLSEKQLEVYTGLAMSLFNETATAIKDDAENMDPYGDYDYAFGLFKERVASQYFSQTIVDHTYEPINKVYQYVNTHVTGF